MRLSVYAVMLSAIILTSCSSDLIESSDSDDTISIEVADPPVIRDLPPKYNMADAVTTDIQGIDLGAPRSSTLTLLRSLSRNEDVISDVRLENYKDRKGRQVKFGITVADSAMLPIEDGKQDSISVKYTTPISGERVTAVSRNVQWPKKAGPNSNEYVESLKNKYGDPSYYREITNNGHTFTMLWIYYDGKKEYIDKPLLGGVGARSCAFVYRDVGYYYNELEGMRNDTHSGCTVTVEVSMVAYDGLLGSAMINITDWRRYYDNAIATDEYIKMLFAEMEDPAQSQSAAVPSR